MMKKHKKTKDVDTVDTAEFYDQIASIYHLTHMDWEGAVKAQAEQLSETVRTVWGTGVESVLDVSCGIGTQSIALASRGFRVTASDLSEQSVARAVQEAESRGLEIAFSVGDMRKAAEIHGTGYDLVICAGNALPHLLTDADILQALEQFHACLRPGGGCYINIRQYDQEKRGRGLLKPFGVREAGDRRYIVFQVWDFEGDYYDFAMYFAEEDRKTGSVQTQVSRSRYYAISPNHVLELMNKAGFMDVKRLDDGLSHPAEIVGTRKG